MIMQISFTHTDGNEDGRDGAYQAAPRSDEEDADTGHDGVDEAMVSRPVATQRSHQHCGLLLDNHHIGLHGEGK